MVTIDYKRCTLVLHIPYNDSCIEDIKNTIPPRARTWSPKLRVWYIGLDYLTSLMEILKKHFDINDMPISPSIPGSLIISNDS